MAITINFQQAVKLFLNYLKEINVEKRWITKIKKTLTGTLKLLIAEELKFYPLNLDKIEKIYSTERMYSIKCCVKRFNTFVQSFPFLKNKTFGKNLNKMKKHFTELSPATLNNAAQNILKVISTDIDKMAIREIPEKVIKKCMLVSDNNILKRCKRFFKFLIHQNILNSKYLPVYQNIFLHRLKKECENLDDGILTLKRAKFIFFKHLLNNTHLRESGLKTMYYCINYFLLFIGQKKEITAVKRNDVVEYMNYLKHKKQYNCTSLAINLGILRRFFRYFMKKGQIKNNPACNIKIKINSKIENSLLNESELSLLFTEAYLNYHKYENCLISNRKDKLHQWLSARDWAIISLLICTGIRPKEITSLQVNDINFKERYVKIEGKGDHDFSVRQRSIPLTEPVVLAAVEIYLKLRPRTIFPHLFINHRLEALAVITFRNIITKIKDQAGIKKNVSISGIRKSYVNLCAQKGLDPLVLKEIMGHNSLATTMKYYLTVKEQYLKELWEKNNPLNYFKKKEYEGWII